MSREPREITLRPDERDLVGLELAALLPALSGEVESPPR